MKLTKREKILLLLLMLAVGAYLYFRFVFIPLSQDIIRLENEQGKMDATVEKLKDNHNIIEDLKQQIDDLEKKKNDLAESVSKTIWLPDILSELEEACARNGVAIDNILFGGDASAIKGKPQGQDGETGIQVQPKSLQGILKDAVGQAGEDSNPSESSGNGRLLKTLTVSFTFNAGYENLMNLIQYYEDNPRLFLLEKLELKRDASGQCSGRISFKVYTIATEM